MNWKDNISKIIENNWSIGQIFTLTDIYKYVNKLVEQYPNNNYIKEKIREVLQDLRNDGIIEFIDNNGSYRRLV